MTVHDDLLAAVVDTTAAATDADQARLDAIRAAVEARVPRDLIAIAAGFADRNGLYKLLRRRAVTEGSDLATVRPRSAAGQAPRRP